MYGEAKKLHLIEEILKIENDSLLDEVETVIAKGKTINLPIRKSFKEFAGQLTSAEVERMKKVIEEGCEQINPDDWK